MNPLKSKFKFIDLLKPEGASLVALLLALDPGQRGRIQKLIAEVGGTEVIKGPKLAPAVRRGGAVRPGEAVRDDSLDSLDAAIMEAFGGEPPHSDGIRRGVLPSRQQIRDFGTLLSLLLMPAKSLEQRLEHVLDTMAGLANDRSFKPEIEADARYLTAAQKLMEPTSQRPGFRTVVFGHAHHAKEVPGDRGTYFNSGTWAGLMQFPSEVLSTDTDVSRPALQHFARRLENQEDTLEDLIDFRPTYVRLEVAAAGPVGASLHDFAKAGLV